MTGRVLTLPSRPATPGRPHRPTYRYPECGHELRVHGSGRHPIFFEIDAEEPDKPVTDRACPRCTAPLLGKAGGGDRS